MPHDSSGRGLSVIPGVAVGHAGTIGLYLKMELRLANLISFIEPFAKGIISGVPGRPKGRPWNNGENIPAFIGWHGKEDPVIDYRSQNVYFYPILHTLYHTENSCLLGTSSPVYTVDDGGTPLVRDMIEVGSENIYNFLTDISIEVPAQCYIDGDTGHGIKMLTDDFSSSPVVKDDTYKYIVARTAVFFQSVMYGTPFSHEYTDTINETDFSCPE